MIGVLILAAMTWLGENPQLVLWALGITEYAKRVLQPFSFYKGWMSTVAGFIVGFAFAIPVDGFVGIEWFQFIANGLLLGLSATGIYKVGESLAEKAFRGTS